MKFPYELSEDRLSLLSKEDQWQYMLEHSIYYSKLLREEGLRQYNHALLEMQNQYLDDINDDVEFKDLPDDEKLEMAKGLSKLEAIQAFENISDMFKESLIEGDITEEEYNQVKERFIKYMMEAHEDEDNLNEDSLAAGHDMTYWLPNGLIAGLLGGLAGALGGLLVAGKDAIAAKLLRRYMNKLVELIDDGANKKKSIFSFFGSKNSGDESQGCFRSIVENVERSRYTMGMTWAHAAGIYKDAKSAVGGRQNGGLEIFNEKIADPIQKI